MSQIKMKVCNNCGAEIPVNAAYCDICGALSARRFIVDSIEERQEKARNAAVKKANRKKTRSQILIIIGVILAVYMLAFGISQLSNRIRYGYYSRNRDLTGWDTIVTADAIEKLEIGMSYEEVKEILGGDGKVSDKSRYWITYAWPSEHYNSNRSLYRESLELEFKRDRYDLKNGKPVLDFMNIHDIIDGDEIDDTRQIIDSRDYGRIDTVEITSAQANQLTEGMSYERVCEIFGGEGKLKSQNIYKSRYNNYIARTYIWKCKWDGADYYFEQEFEDGIIKYLYDWRNDWID